jgi:hypothetical protein
MIAFSSHPAFKVPGILYDAGALHIVVKPTFRKATQSIGLEKLEVFSKPTLWRNSRQKASFRSQSVSLAGCGFGVLTWHSLCCPFAPTQPD